jgi:uncharacterized protein with NRDE domain
MCLLFIAINRHPDYPLIIAGNRDEFCRRPTAKLSFWKDRPDLLAGRDLEAGGVWLGVTRSGRIAAITNYRDPSRVKAHALSRGLLVLDFLAGSSTPLDFCRENADRMARCNGFNLIYREFVRSLLLFQLGPGAGCLDFRRPSRPEQSPAGHALAQDGEGKTGPGPGAGCTRTA